MFIRENITEKDTLIVSVGGNDIALAPSWSTILNMILLLSTNTDDTLRRRPLEAWGIDHFISLFRDQVKGYIMKLCGKTMPKRIIICSIYNPDMNSNGKSWANRTLSLLGYNSKPERLQLLIRQLHIHATCRIDIPGTEIVHFPMHAILDGTDTTDYIERCEPSMTGGAKLAEALSKLIQ